MSTGTAQNVASSPPDGDGHPVVVIGAGPVGLAAAAPPRVKPTRPLRRPARAAGEVVAVRIDIRMLGAFEVRVDGRPVPPDRWLRRHSAALVKLLALTPGRSLHREQVIDALWPDLRVPDAAPRLHKAAHFARRTLGSREALVLVADGVLLGPGHEVHVDVQDFQVLADEAVARGGPAAAKAALSRYGGDLLPLDVYEPWAQHARDTLGRLHRDLLRQAGDWHHLVALDPTDEQAHLALARRYADDGDSRSALLQLDRLETAVRRDLGLRPGAEARALRAHLSGAAEDDLARLEHALACVGRQEAALGLRPGRASEVPVTAGAATVAPAAGSCCG